MRESIARDAALWSNLPPGPGRDEFAEHIALRTQELQAKRTQAADLVQQTLVGATSMFGVAYVFIAGSTAFGGEKDVVAAFQLPTLLLSFGLAAVFIAVVLAICSTVLSVVGWVRALARRRRAVRERRAASASD